MTEKEYNKLYYRTYHKERTRRLKERHLCLYCRKQDERTLAGFCHCSECAEKANERAKRRYRERKQSHAT